jgi:hypothetical protein
MDWATGGAFHLNTLAALMTGRLSVATIWSARDLWLVGMNDLVVRGVLTCAVGCWMVWGRGLSLARRGLGLYCLASMAISLAQLVKVNADMNYLLEPFALGGIAGAVAYQRWLGPDSTLKGRRRRLLWLAAAVVLGWWLAKSLPLNVGNMAYLNRMDQVSFREKDLVKLAPPVLLMDHAFTHPDPEAHAICDVAQYGAMLERGKVSPEPLAERLRGRRWRLVAISAVTRRWLLASDAGRPIRLELERGYEQLPGMDRPELWVPRAFPQQNHPDETGGP